MILPRYGLGRGCNLAAHSNVHHTTQWTVSISRVSTPSKRRHPRLYSTGFGDDPRMKDVGKLIQDEYAKLRDHYGMNQETLRYAIS